MMTEHGVSWFAGHALITSIDGDGLSELNAIEFQLH